ncbi:glyoxylase-like metal-dependent hydrolase (beta-lactamase superfamily II) [Roseicyclus mahoneyensis]|uniref:Glyoxylase-like metal-dependent hydrolase (Beta-lactamase superfamily II) n=2 Tax=Roseicyclus mahoneyensis TaxID=164332 RepID=A0A316GPU6_9RHOB|nr:glyoxylase-like metal-dependent hydrolase (beta-lactamase superfamily II) [Roseicyclus mahoneyensis]
MESESGVVWLEPGLRRLTAPNPSPMTFRGTNTYIVGTGEVAVIDPGPDHAGHMDAILGALTPGERIGAILVTHSHRDHSPLARRLSQQTGAPVLAAGPSDWGRSAVMAALAASTGIGGGEGVDRDFVPDARIAEGDIVAGDWGEIAALETPGHMANHLSFAWKGAVFTGDLVMGWSTSLVSPPDGDMGAFMASCRKLARREDRVFHPGHGDPVTAPRSRLADLIAHREAREAQILNALSTTAPTTASAIALQIYTNIPANLLPAAERNVLAHLIDLEGRNLVVATAQIGVAAPFLRR